MAKKMMIRSRFGLSGRGERTTSTFPAVPEGITASAETYPADHVHQLRRLRRAEGVVAGEAPLPAGRLSYVRHVLGKL